jgi:hypothetical protein
VRAAALCSGRPGRLGRRQRTDNLRELREAPIRPFDDPHCDTEGSAHKYGEIQLPITSTAITLTNGATAEETKKATIWIFKIALIHGFRNVVIECTNVEGTGTAKNNAGPPMGGTGLGTIKFNDGTGILCHTNQSGCDGGTATVGGLSKKSKPRPKPSKARPSKKVESQEAWG